MRPPSRDSHPVNPVYPVKILLLFSPFASFSRISRAISSLARPGSSHLNHLNHLAPPLQDGRDGRPAPILCILCILRPPLKGRKIGTPLPSQPSRPSRAPLTGWSRWGSSRKAPTGIAERRRSHNHLHGCLLGLSTVLLSPSATQRGQSVPIRRTADANRAPLDLAHSGTRERASGACAGDLCHKHICSLTLSPSEWTQAVTPPQDATTECQPRPLGLGTLWAQRGKKQRLGRPFST